MPSLRSFVSHLPVPLLLTFLAEHQITLEAEDIADGPFRITAAIDEILCEGPLGKRAALLAEIETIDKLAGEAGAVAVESVTLGDELAGLESRHARALWLFLNDRDRFRRAEESFYSDTQRYGRQWTAFSMAKGQDITTDTEALEELRQALRLHFETPNVHLEIFERSRPSFVGDDDDESDGEDRLVQISIYREDKPNTEYAFVEGAFGTQVRRSVIEAAVTYEPSTGAIECVAEGRDSRAEIVRLVATGLLQAETDFEPAAMRAYDLTILGNPISFATDPSDRIHEVRVTMMRLVPTDTSAERITVESLAESDRDIWTCVSERLGADALTSDYHVTQARIVIRYRTGESPRLRSLPITITHPHRSNIKERIEIERLVANKYLPRWGLVTA